MKNVYIEKLLQIRNSLRQPLHFFLSLSEILAGVALRFVCLDGGNIDVGGLIKVADMIRVMKIVEFYFTF
jgi:hypothetical protein